MKSWVKKTAIHSLTLFLLSSLFTGIKITGGIPTLILAGFVLTLMSFFVRPILHIVTLPLTILTLGTLTFLHNVVILYLLTIFVSDITIDAFRFPGYGFAGFSIPAITFNTFFAYVFLAFMFSVIEKAIKWCSED